MKANRRRCRLRWASVLRSPQRNSLSADDADWIAAESLKTGDLLRNSAGEWKPIIAIERVAETRATFNFEVEGNHNYFVGLSGWLVHNHCEDRLVSLYQSTTKRGSITNVGINVTKLEFIDGLMESGFTKSLSKDGISINLVKGSKKYSVREKAKSVPGPTGDVFSSGKLIKKLRLER